MVPAGHPLAGIARPVLQDLAAYPLITHDVGFTGRSHIDTAFHEAGLRPDIVLTAMDSDVIQQYVALDLGAAIVASMARGSQHALRPIEAVHLFAVNVTRLAVRRGAYLRSYTVDFILQFAPSLQRGEIERAVHIGAG